MGPKIYVTLGFSVPNPVNLTVNVKTGRLWKVKRGICPQKLQHFGAFVIVLQNIN